MASCSPSQAGPPGEHGSQNAVEGLFFAHRAGDRGHFFGAQIGNAPVLRDDASDPCFVRIPCYQFIDALAGQLDLAHRSDHRVVVGKGIVLILF